MFSVSGSDRAIRDPIKPELWDLLFALQSSPNCPKTAGNTCLLYRSFSSTAYWGNTHLSYKTQMFTETDRSYIWGQALKLHKIQIWNTLFCTKAEPCRLLIAVSARGNQGGGWRQLFALRWIIDGKTASDRPLYFWIFFHPYFFIREGVNWKKTFSFRHCLNYLNPPPPMTPIRATWSSFFGSRNSRFESQFRTKNTIYTI